MSAYPFGRRVYGHMCSPLERTEEITSHAEGVVDHHAYALALSQFGYRLIVRNVECRIAEILQIYCLGPCINERLYVFDLVALGETYLDSHVAQGNGKHRECASVEEWLCHDIASQALWMGRTRGLHFDTVLFTNLSRDHIGGVEHPDFEHYRDCKKLLFTDYPACTAVVNRNDGHAAYMTEGIQTPVLDFGLCDSTDTDKPLWAAACIRPMNRDGRIGVGFEAFRGGISLGDSWFLPLPGQFNVQNALSALTVVCEGFGVDPLRAKRALEQAVAAGRFESIISPALPDVTFVIDYAHNGISLASILDALKEYRPTRLICLFGSVGGRTRERRRDLAEAAGHRCDLCILTSDNPACEPPMEIIDEIDAAFPEGSCPRIKISDRAEAIRYAVEIAEAGDIILLAGKGHEDYQLIRGEKVYFSEKEILRREAEEFAAVGAFAPPLV